MSVKLRASGWELAGQHLPWIWGQINYWDLDRARWRDVLRAYAERGNTVVSAAVLPRVHQTAPEAYDFGALRPQNDLAAFLAEAAQIGLKVVLWLGPRDTPGMAAAGYTDDLLQDETALARDAAGALLVSSPGPGGDVFCLPSLVSARLGASLDGFSRAVGKVLAPFIHPDGPVIGLGLTLAPAWAPALSAFAADYHPESLALYRDFLKQRYRRLPALNAAYGSNYAAFEEVEPPRAAGPEADYFGPCLQDWAQFREEYFVRAAETLHGLFSPVAQDRIPIFLAAHPASGRPGNLAELDRSRCFAYVMPELTAGQEPDAEEDFLFSLAGQNRYLAWFQARPELAYEDESEREYQLLRQVASGLRGWDALAPCGSGGLPGFLADRLGASCHALDAFWETLREQSRKEGFLQSQLHAEVALLTLPEFERAKYLQTPPRPRYDLLDIQRPPRPAAVLDGLTAGYQERLSRLEHFLVAGQYAYVRLEGDASPDRFTDNQVLLLPGADTLPAPFQARVAEWLEKGVSLIIAGPLPAHPADAAHPPLSELAGAKSKTVKGGGRAKTRKSGRLYHLPVLEEAKFTRLLQQIGVARELVCDDPRLRLTFHRFRNRLFVAVCNPCREPVETSAQREGKFVLKDFWNGKRFIGGNQEIRLTLPARSVKFWELIPC